METGELNEALQAVQVARAPPGEQPAAEAGMAALGQTAEDQGNAPETVEAAKPEALPPRVEHDVDDLRRQAREALFAGAKSGKLLAVLGKSSEQDAPARTESAQPDELELLRQQAREALLEGAQSGKLFDVLMKPDETEEISALKTRLFDALARSMETGELNEALQAVQVARAPPGEQPAAEAGMAALGQTADDQGNDLETVEAAKPEKALPCAPEDDVDDLRRQAREALLSGAKSGKLMELLAKNSEQKAVSKRPSTKNRRSEEVELLRQQARQSLLDGAQSGKLLDVLAKPDETDEVFALKTRLFDALVQSMETGELTEALQAVQTARAEDMLAEATMSIRNGPASDKVLQVLAAKTKSSSAPFIEEEGNALETTQKPEELSQTTEVPKALSEADRLKALELALQLKALQEEKRTMTAQKACLEDILQEMEMKNDILRSRSRRGSKEEV